MNKKSIILKLCSLTIMILGFIIASSYWYEGETKEGFSPKAGIIIICFWTAGVLLLMWTKVLEYKPPLKELVILVIAFNVSGYILESKKNKIINANSGNVYGQVLFVGTKGRMGFGFEYAYKLNDKAYYKWDNNEDFIRKNKFNPTCSF
jgi:hypothetical protein